MFKNLNPGMIGIHASLAEAMDMAVQYGFDGVDLNLPDVAELARETSVEEVRGLFARAGCRPGNWGLPIEWHDSHQGEMRQMNWPGFAGMPPWRGTLAHKGRPPWSCPGRMNGPSTRTTPSTWSG